MNGPRQLIKLASYLPEGSADNQILLRMAMEFDTDEALKKYLKEHPAADKSLHSVKKEKDHGDLEEDEDFGHLQTKFNKFLDKVKGLGAKTLESLKKAPVKVQAFVVDPKERKKVLTEASDIIKKSPEAIARNALKAVKGQVKEFKDAGTGVAKVYRGEPLTHHDKKAMFSVGVTMAGVVIAAATGGTAAAAGTFGKGLARSIATSAVHGALGDLNLMNETGTVAFELGHLFTSGGVPGHHASLKVSKKEPSEDEMMNGFTNLILSKVHKSLKDGISDEDLHKVLREEEPEGAERYDEPEGKKGALIRLASSLPKGSEDRRTILNLIQRI